MSFGGSVSAMLSSLKNNSRKKRKTIFDKDGHTNSGRHLNNLINKKATPEQLAEIKQKLDKQNKKARKKNLIILTIVVIFIVLSFVYLSN